ncbi:lytic transglycosylase domain-containing protein [Paenibacillus xerothermodurans]|uniref:Lytic transglycosylase domain-containing protein n=1 Tax=Paenibacillus xerothermodurans TaxID=1977292 RepID=A0A2W1ND97_PAEXE|nr:lytic transglycosylase domain-containing protein [Paenibacillus xerothermodurans]PZE22679.1 lytic transglycosylase domain-containing protein [Paenibacillus xerothermodurans]
MNKIDPRTIKELLHLQMLSQMDQIAGGAASAAQADSDFSDLLNTILAQSVEAGTLGADAAPTNAVPPLKPATAHPGLTFANTNPPPAGAAPRSLTGKAVELDPVILDASNRHAVKPSLVQAVIDAESSFNTNAVSSAGAKGLMQLMDQTSRSLGVTNPFDPVQNIEGGTRYLSDLLSKYNGNQATALAAYNAGPGRLHRLGIANDSDLAANMHLLPRQTQNYVTKVTRLQREYEA